MISSIQGVCTYVQKISINSASISSSSPIKLSQLDRSKIIDIILRIFIFQLLLITNVTFAQGITKPTVSTDKLDYAPGETVIINSSGFSLNSTIEFQIADNPNDPGDYGEADTYKPFSVKYGEIGDLDGITE